MKIFEDPYKSEGIVQLKIEKLSQCAQGELKSRRDSDAIYVRGLPWKIITANLENDTEIQVVLKPRVLGYYLECSPKNAGPEWSCNCSATLKVLAQKDGKEDYIHEITEVFNAKHKHSGDTTFMTFDALMNPELGWYDEATDDRILRPRTLRPSKDFCHKTNKFNDIIYIIG